MKVINMFEHINKGKNLLFYNKSVDKCYDNLKSDYLCVYFNEPTPIKMKLIEIIKNISPNNERSLSYLTISKLRDILIKELKSDNLIILFNNFDMLTKKTVQIYQFNFKVDMKGADQYEDPLCYTSSGLTGNGTVDTINVTSNTIKDIVNKDFKSAMFQTPVTGHFDMYCAAWTGYSNFTNNGTDFIGYFKINGPMTDFEGTYRFIPQGTRIAIVSSYLWWNVNSTNKKQVNRTYYI